MTELAIIFGLLAIVAGIGSVKGAMGYRVLATTFDDEQTATGVNGTQIGGVALPDRSALRRSVVVRYNGNEAYFPVIDLGPWNIDDPYWNTGGVPLVVRDPQARPYSAGYLKPTNAAGIDLTPKAWERLGVPSDVAWSGTFSAIVEWDFV